tara:strand:- start:4068 stop:5999 length:1932 start_codon:yes stop_codon:yes gene_type:complete
MCGITLIKSFSKDVIGELIASLEQLQNRGYDSVGIGYFDISNIEIKKYASTNQDDCFKELQENYKKSAFLSKCAIGHTRWATHGQRNTTNAHPHLSHDNKFAIVHNGIIENFIELRDFLREKDITSKSETDTEIVANLIAYYYQKTDINTPEQAIYTACKNLQGTFALGIICIDEPESIYIIRNGSPLIFGKNEDFMICTSELSGFNNMVNNYIKLDNNILYKLGNNNHIADIEIIKNLNDDSQQQQLPETLTIDSKLQELNSTSSGIYANFTLKEIYEQPESILRAFNYGGRIKDNKIKLGGLQKLVDNFPNRLDIDHVILLGCGTSLHACMIAANYILNNCDFVSVNYYDASEFTSKNISKSGRSLVILCSQSGETRDLYESLEICKKSNCITLGVINQVDSLIAHNVDFGVYLNAGREVGVASTKSFTSMIVVLSQISLFFSNYFNKISDITRENIIENLRNLSNSVDKLLKNDDLLGKIQQVNEKILNTECKNSIFLLGKSNNFGIAREISLKIKELCYIHAEGFSGSALKHGPFALLEENSIVILIITDKTQQVMLNCYQEIAARGANTIIFTNSSQILQKLQNKLGEKLDIIYVETLKYYSEINFTVALQYLTYDLSMKLEINPDKPRNLAKVVTVQ